MQEPSTKQFSPAVLVLVLFTGCAGYTGAEKTWTGIDRLDAGLSQQIDRRVNETLPNYRYVNVAIVRAGEIDLTRTYGKNRLSKRDVYASVSKPVTAMILMQLVEEGKIASLDDEIGRYAPKYRDAVPEEYANSTLTFRQLLCHRGGVPHQSKLWSGKKLRLAFRPGSNTQYSTHGYGILGAVMREITGKSYKQLVREYVAKPVGADSMTVNLAWTFDAPAGQVTSTISDMASFAVGVMDGRYVSNDFFCDEILKPYGRDSSGAIGLGWFCANPESLDLAAYHAGSNGRPRAFLLIKPRKRLAIAITGRNRSSKGAHDFGALARDLMAIVDDDWRSSVAKAGFPAKRVVDVASFTPGVPVDVRLTLDWKADASSLTVVEQVPAGWTVRPKPAGKGISVEAEENTIVWDVAPWASPGVTLEYAVIPPADSQEDSVAFVGGYFEDVSGYPLPIETTSLTRNKVFAFQQGTLPSPEYDGCMDAHIFAFRPGGNSGACEHLEEGDWFGGSGDHKKTLIRFDLSSVPPDFSFDRATLRLYLFGERRSGARERHTVYAARLVKPWNEGAGASVDGHDAQGGDVTFQSAEHNRQTWEKPGATGADDVAEAESSMTAGDQVPTWIDLDVTKSVRHFLKNPDENFGWKISQDAAAGVDGSATSYVTGVYMFKSSEALEIHLRPMLILAPTSSADEAANNAVAAAGRSPAPDDNIETVAKDGVESSGHSAR